VLSTSGETWPDELAGIDVRDLAYVDLPWRMPEPQGAMP
jgi:hypothetical protein